MTQEVGPEFKIPVLPKTNTNSPFLSPQLVPTATPSTAYKRNHTISIFFVTDSLSLMSSRFIHVIACVKTFSFFFFETGSHYVAQAGLELKILLSHLGLQVYTMLHSFAYFLIEYFGFVCFFLLLSCRNF
jgi:hypothetical protein